MKKQIIRLTESDFYRIIKESVKKIIKESEEPTREELMAQFEDAKSRMKAYKGKRAKQKEFLEAAQEYSRLKTLLGVGNIVHNPDAGFTDRENEKRGIKKKVGLRRVTGFQDLVKSREEDRRDKEGLKGVKANDIDSILGGG